ncbi:PLP-dependent aminotransferase family protein [Paucibacter sp. Y2R2-4]|uniref:aminotransferase-like domain-containing protein n=1 Tax=Paucibacter sp. Y2R2-4 TaxID=2893553 RepID=UPI0021E4C82C|nr:PLP-dependent aminotransferase family protein [Paucibacter sp. Y2R2-4]MCV2352031.1 PLP-dependent aminotransferase family protein [Paucibacter sp. Y2R2-4]
MNSRAYRYRSLAAKLAEDLRAGVYPSGTRLPSVRQLCVDHGASLATIVHALHDLEDAGLIEARPRQGFFASKAKKAATAPASRVSMELAGRRKRLMALAASQPDCVSLGHLALPASLLPIATLRRLMTRELRVDPAALSGGTVYGTEQLRQQLALRAPRMGCQFNAEDIVVTQGEGESLQLCLRLLSKPGDLIAVSSPAPLRALELIASLGLRALEIPAASEGGLSIPALSRALAEHKIAACLMEPSFYRASGGLMSEAQKQSLMDLLTQHHLPMIECDMMGELYRGAQRPRPLKSLDREDWVLYCGSFACITGTGFSLGYVVSGRWRLPLRAARAVHGELIPRLSDQVLAAFLASDAFDLHLRRLRLRLAKQVQAHEEAVLAQFPAGTRVSSGEGGYALWVELPGHLDACTLLERARQQGYNFVPGAVFSLGTQFDHCLRLTAAHPLDAARMQGLRTLGQLARELAAT